MAFSLALVQFGVLLFTHESRAPCLLAHSEHSWTRQWRSCVRSSYVVVYNNLRKTQTIAFHLHPCSYSHGYYYILCMPCVVCCVCVLLVGGERRGETKNTRAAIEVVRKFAFYPEWAGECAQRFTPCIQKITIRSRWETTKSNQRQREKGREREENREGGGGRRRKGRFNEKKKNKRQNWFHSMLRAQSAGDAIVQFGREKHY